MNIKQLYRTPTTTVGALPTTNYFDVEGGYKKYLSDWNYTYQEQFDFDAALAVRGGRKISIPYMPQLNGDGEPFYTNDRYLFPYLPPHILTTTPAMILTRTESITLCGEDYILRVEGIDNSYYLFVNGEFVGFSNISHAQKEFDITKNLVDGENEIRIIALKFSPSSYLEDQDKIRLFGVHRPISLIRRPHDRVSSFVIRTDIADGEGIVTVTVDRDAELHLFGFGFDERIQGREVSFRVPSPRLWSAEEPNLYELEISYGGELIREIVGIRKIEMIGNRLLLNGKLIKMKGVNRHSSTLSGYAESREIMEEDIRLFKQLNINAVRTSHYPAAQEFYELCDRHGIYVISETDLEAHGVVRVDGRYDMENWHEILSHPDFYDQIVERELSNVLTNINHPSVIMWSLGNESGFCDEVVEYAKIIKERDTRPLHYEGAYRNVDGKGFFDENVLDTYSRMYPSIEYCRDEVPKLDRPFILCEYSHAMGTSCGELADYMVPFYEYDNFSGAFLWEWTNHYVVRDGIECYGGDFGEAFNDGAFCCDGIVNLDRTLTPQAYEVKECYSPIDCFTEGGRVYIKNRFDFLNLDRFDIEIESLKNGRPTGTDRIRLSLEPGERAFIADEPPTDENYNSYNIRLIERDSGYIMSERSIVSKPRGFAAPKAMSEISAEISHGLIGELSLDGERLLSGMSFNLSRPYISNDIKVRDFYDYIRIRDAKFYPVSEEEQGNVRLYRGYLASPALRPFYEITLKYEVLPDEIRLDIKADKMMDFEGPLRFGLKFTLPDGYGNISYLGLRGESYCDRNTGNPFGYHTISVDDNYRNIVPQCSGDRFGTKYLVLDGSGLCIECGNDGEMSFCYDCYDICDYKAHRGEMKSSDKRYLFVDYKLRGIGTEACGPTLNSKYKVNDSHIDFSLRIFKIGGN